MDYVSKIQVPGGTTYNITGVIPMGTVASTSTSTVYTATISGITELKSGVCVWLTNGVVTSAANFTININGLGAKPVYRSNAATTRETTRFDKAYTIFLIYNETRVSGGCWDYVYGFDSNTTYTNMSQTEASAGTATIGRIISAKVLSNTIEEHTAEINAVLPELINEGAKNLATPYTYNVYNGGITITRDDEFRVIASGTAGATIRYIVTQLNLTAGSYIVSGCTDGSGSTYRLRIGTGTENTYLDAVTTEETTITLSADTLVTIEVNVFNGVTVSNKIFPVMIRKAYITDNTYVPPAYSQPELTKKMLLTAPDAPLKILCVGDSISYGARNGLRGFVGGLGFPYQIDGITGATLSTAQSGVKNIPQQLIDSTYSDPDVIISNGGVNDYLQNAPLGVMPTALVTDDTADGALDLSTICGGVQHLFYNMIKKYPNAQRFFLLTHKTTASAPVYTYGNNLALVTTQTRQSNGVDFVNNSNNTFAVFRTPTTSAPITAGFTLADVSLGAGTYIFDGLNDGRWTTSSDEYLLLRYKNKSTSATVCDITNKPVIVTFGSAVTLQASFYVGKLYDGTYRIVTPVIKKCTSTTTVHDWTTVPNRALLTQTDIYNAIREIAKLYGVKIIDVFNESMMNTAFSQYVSPTHWDSDHSVTDREYCDDDGIHPLNKGYENAYLPIIRQALQIGTEK